MAHGSGNQHNRSAQLERARDLIEGRLRSLGREVRATPGETMAQTYSGGCQCGKVRYEVELELGEVIACNCSRCGRLGSLLAFAPKSQFKLLSGEEDLATY